MEPIAKVGNAVVGIGAGGTIVFGIWLAFSSADTTSGTVDHRGARPVGHRGRRSAQRTGVAYMAGMKKAKELEAAGQTGPSAELLALNRTQPGSAAHAVERRSLLLILIDMIWKPGA